MRVGFDITQAAKRQGRGIARYIRQVVPPLAEQGLDMTLHIRGHRWFQRRTVSEMAPGVKRAWMPLGNSLGKRNLDVFHSFGNHLPEKSSVPLSFTVHDVRALDSPAGYEGRDRLIENIERASGVLCLTQYGKDRLLHHCPSLADKPLAAVPHGVDHDLFNPQSRESARAAAKFYQLEQPYLLQLGSWFPHKNLELSIEAFARSRALSQGYLLAMVGGGAGKAYRKKLDALAASLGVSHSLRWIENVPGVDLPGLLGAARVLLQPSKYEGFALPLLEAMATGLPGVVSDSSCLPEVSAGIWPIASPEDAAGFAEGVDLMAFDDSAREQAIHAGLEHASLFTWERTARSTVNFLADVAGIRSSGVQP